MRRTWLRNFEDLENVWMFRFSRRKASSSGGSNPHPRKISAQTVQSLRTQNVISRASYHYTRTRFFVETSKRVAGESSVSESLSTVSPGNRQSSVQSRIERFRETPASSWLFLERIYVSLKRLTAPFFRKLSITPMIKSFEREIISYRNSRAIEHAWKAS